MFTIKTITKPKDNLTSVLTSENEKGNLTSNDL